MTPPRDPISTRAQIVDVAAETFWSKGYKSTSLNDILDGAGVSKGALYHHFKNKLDLAMAVFDEVYEAEFFGCWTFDDPQDPLDALCERFRELAERVDDDVLERGCPVANMAIEMASVDDDFRERTAKMYTKLSDRFESMLLTAQKRGFVREDIDTAAVAIFVTAAMQGMKQQGTYARSIDTFKSSIRSIADYLASLRP